MNANEILNKIENNKNIFITGQAGVGKTYILKNIVEELRDNDEEVALLSSTGVSAMQLGGITGHSFFGSGIAQDMSSFKSIIDAKIWGFTCKKTIRNTSVIVIDEISMISGKLFTLWDNLTRHACNNNLPFGGKKVIISGDFLQLPPVNKDSTIIDWPFNSLTWRELEIENIILTEVKRQNDIEFVTQLGKMRIGEMDQEAIEYFNKLERVPEDGEDITKLVATNAEAKAINTDRLNKIPNESIIFTSEFSGDSKKYKQLLEDSGVDEEIELKVGAKVMTTINMKGGEDGFEFVNGTIGTIIEINPYSIVIKKDSDGKEVLVGENVWEKLNINGRVVASMKQLPIKLAWAITIHKSQGMTIDELDVDCRKVFTDGQLYVALSRVVSSDKLYLRGFDPNKVWVEPHAKEFYTGTKAVVASISEQQVPQVSIEDAVEESLPDMFAIDFEAETVVEQPQPVVEPKVVVNNNDIYSWENVKELNVKNVEDFVRKAKNDNPTKVGIDTETTGLDPIKDKPFDIIVGYHDSKGTYKYINFIAESLRNSTTVEQLKAHTFTNEEIEACKLLLKEFDSFVQVYHNAKYDIEMLQQVVGDDFIPTRFVDTQIMTKHIEKNLVDGQSTALKKLVDYYHIRSVIPELEEFKTKYLNAGLDKGKVIRENLNLFPVSKPFMNNLEKLEKGISTTYFDKLLFSPEELIEFYKQLQTEEVQNKFKEMFPEWKMSIQDTYKYITDVYNVGYDYEECRKVLRKFNQEVLGFKDEWATIFKTGNTYNFPDYLNILNRDSSALLIYAAMDVKITLDLFDVLNRRAVETGFTSNKNRMKVMKQDFDCIAPIIMQEKTGLYLDKEYIEEAIIKAKRQLKEINGFVQNSLTMIAEGDDWKEALGIENSELKATDYKKYSKFFTIYTPFYSLPLHTPKDPIKVDTTTKLCELYTKYHSDDRELVQKMIDVNRGDVFAPYVGNSKNDGFIFKVYSTMITKAKELVEEREKEIIANPRLSLRKEEKGLKEILSSLPENPAEGIMKIKEVSMRTNKVGNEMIKALGINLFNTTRTINKKNSHQIKRLDIEDYAAKKAEEGKALTQVQISKLYEIKKVIDYKAAEASALKWIGVYMIKLLGQLSISADDRIRTSYMIAGPVTGRLSADIQQNPKKPLKDIFTNEELYHPRRAFKVKGDVDEDVVYAYLDFSQIELRCAAEYTMVYGVPDEVFIRAYLPFNCYSKEYGKYNPKEHKKVFLDVDWYFEETLQTKWTPTDLHMLPVRQAFPEYFDANGVPLPEYLDTATSLRNACKGINFGILYGSGLNGILTNPSLADFPTEALTKIYNAQKTSYPQLAQFQKMIMNRAKQSGIVYNIQGRGYEQGFPKERDRNGDIAYGESYKAVNYLVQGEAAGVLKQCMIRVYKYIKDNNLKTKMLLNIHDEIGYMVPKDEIEHIVKIQDIMQDIEWWDMHAVSDMEVATTSWAEKIEVKDIEEIRKVIGE